MPRLLLLGFLFLYTGAGNAEIYKWTDEHGKVQFGDRPPNHVTPKKITVKSNSYTSVEVIYNPDWFYQRKNKPRPKEVVMYSATWCGVCKKAKKYFASQNISYTDYDIETSAKGKADFQSLGASSVPVLFIGQVRMNGFRQSAFDKVYYAAKDKPRPAQKAQDKVKLP